MVQGNSKQQAQDMLANTSDDCYLREPVHLVVVRAFRQVNPQD